LALVLVFVIGGLIAKINIMDNNYIIGKKLNLLTSFRFFAASVVFFYHFGKDIISKLPFFLSCWLPHGPMAVTFFFILSGFVLTYSNTEKRKLKKRKSQFLISRFARIYPIYLVALLIPLPHKLWVVLHSSAIPSEFYTLPLVLTLTQSWIPSLATSWNPPAWSLSVEALFYATFPLIILIVSKLKTVYFFFLSVMILIFGEFFRGVLFSHERFYAEFFPIFHLPKFIFGIAIARCFLESKISLRFGAFWMALFLTIIYVELLFFSPSRLQWVLPVVSCCLGGVVLCAANLSGVSLLFLQKPIPLLLGEASYGLYITHMPVMIGYQRLLGFFGYKHPECNIAILLSGFIFCNLFSILLLYFIEIPARKWILLRCG